MLPNDNMSPLKERIPEGGFLISPKQPRRSITEQSPTMMRNKIQKLVKLHQHYKEKKTKAQNQFYAVQNIRQQLQNQLAAKRLQQQKAQPTQFFISNFYQKRHQLSQLLQQIKTQNHKKIQTQKQQIAFIQQQLNQNQHQQNVQYTVQLENTKNKALEAAQKVNNLQLLLNKLQDQKNKLTNEFQTKKIKSSEEGVKKQQLISNIAKVQKNIKEKKIILNSIKEEENKGADLSILQKQLAGAETKKNNLNKRITELQKIKQKKQSSNKQMLIKEEQKEQKILVKIEAQKAKKQQLEKVLQQLKESHKKATLGYKLKYESKNKTEDRSKILEQRAIIKMKIEQTQQKIFQETEILKRFIHPSAIINIKKQINDIEQDNKQIEILLKSNQGLQQQIKILDEKAQGLLWNENTELIKLQAKVTKVVAQLVKAREELQELKKKENQLKRRILQYSTSYPDFEPINIKKKIAQKQKEEKLKQITSKDSKKNLLLIQPNKVEQIPVIQKKLEFIQKAQPIQKKEPIQKQIQAQTNSKAANVDGTADKKNKKNKKNKLNGNQHFQQAQNQTHEKNKTQIKVEQQIPSKFQQTLQLMIQTTKQQKIQTKIEKKQQQLIVQIETKNQQIEQNENTNVEKKQNQTQKKKNKNKKKR